MSSVSKSQQRAAGMAKAAKEGKIPMKKLRGAAKQMAKSMTTEEIEKFASTPHQGLPEHVRPKAGKGRGGNMAHRAYAKRRRDDTRAYG